MNGAPSGLGPEILAGLPPWGISGLSPSYKEGVQSRTMARKTKSHWVAVMTAVITAVFEGVSTLGWPVDIRNPIAQFVAFLVFGLALIKIIHSQSRELDAFYHPEFDLTVTAWATNQKDTQLNPGSWDAIYWRIVIANNSDMTLKNCRVSLESWTFESVGLNLDTALNVKDEVAVECDIRGRDRRQFNFLINKHKTNTDVLDVMRVQAPNLPQITSPHGGYSAKLRVNADNLDTRWYQALMVIDAQGIRITNMIEGR